MNSFKIVVLFLFLTCSTLLQAQMNVFVSGDESANNMILDEVRTRFPSHTYTDGIFSTLVDASTNTTVTLSDFDAVLYVDRGFATEATIDALVAYVEAGGFVYANLEWSFANDGSAPINALWNNGLQGHLKDPTFSLLVLPGDGLSNEDGRVVYNVPTYQKNYLRHGKYSVEDEVLSRTFLSGPNNPLSVQFAFGGIISDPPEGSVIGVSATNDQRPLAILLYGDTHFNSVTAGAIYMHADLNQYGQRGQSTSGYAAIENFLNLAQIYSSSGTGRSRFRLQEMEFGRNNN